MTYKCRHFAIHELVPKKVFEERGEKAWQLLDDRMLRTIDMLRDRYGSMTINNYFWGKNREWSGLRTPDSPYYSVYSQHTHGTAFDIIFAETTAESVRQDILANPDAEVFKYITTVELDTSWLHVDCRCITRIFTFKP